jgi:hypothetical protein
VEIEAGTRTVLISVKNWNQRFVIEVFIALSPFVIIETPKLCVKFPQV